MVVSARILTDLHDLNSKTPESHSGVSPYILTKLIPFSSHAGSGLSGFDDKLADVCPNSTIGEGLAISGSDAQNDQDRVRNTVNDWLTGLGY